LIFYELGFCVKTQTNKIWISFERDFIQW
jgi:hypothetical protein